ncbi:amidase [Hyaloraphidium curvatum]|nr:amidase [Hyaloraphidium curvatum]
MSSDDLAFLPAVELGRRIAAGKITSEAATHDLLDRISKHDAKLHSYAKVLADSALADARAADAELKAGKSRGPLHGVPVAVKDLCDVAGVPTLAGMPLVRKDHVAAKDSGVVRKLKEAGAVIVGKLQLTEGALARHHHENKVPVNPWNPKTWSGASSSGSGVATAAGLCYASLGSDTGGSIRFPSNMNGLTGHKPTWGRVSRAGVFALSPTLDHIGPMCRTAEDCAAVLGAIAGPDPDDPTAVLDAVPDYVGQLAGGIKGLKIGIDKNVLAKTGPATQQALDAAVKTLTSLGGTTVDITLPDMLAASKAWEPLCVAECAAVHEDTFPSRASEYGPLKSTLELAPMIPCTAVAKADILRADLRGQFDALFAQCDVLVLPVLPGDTLPASAFAHDAPAVDLAEVVMHTSPIDMTGLPCLTLPCGMTADGPIGFQIVGARWADGTVLKAGHAFQGATEFHKVHPKLEA